MKTLGIAILATSLLASGAVSAHHRTGLPANATKYYGLYQGPADASAPVTGDGRVRDPRYPADGLHPSPADRASTWRF
jgi:hypothetical protein